MRPAKTDRDKENIRFRCQNRQTEADVFVSRDGRTGPTETFGNRACIRGKRNIPPNSPSSENDQGHITDKQCPEQRTEDDDVSHRLAKDTGLVLCRN